MATTKKPLLDLDTLVQRDRIKIDGESYEIRNPGELSLLESHRLRRIGQQIDTLFSERKPTDAQLRELDRLTRQSLAAVVVDLPAEVEEKLAHAQRWAILGAFTNRSTPASATPQKKPATKAQSRRKRASGAR